MIPVQFQCVREWNPGEIVDLYRSAGWWDERYDPAGILPLIQGSHIFAVGIEEKTGKAVAMGRIISDRVQTGYIHDLCVLDDFRGEHIGIRLLSYLIREGRSAGLVSLHLVAQPGTARFYEKTGFICDKRMIFLNKDTTENSYDH
jgi:GNAT superfamily N-acetyltransferase